MIRSAQIPEINAVVNEMYTFTYDSYIAHNPIQPYNFCSCECLHHISQLHHILFEFVVRGFAISYRCVTKAMIEWCILLYFKFTSRHARYKIHFVVWRNFAHHSVNWDDKVNGDSIPKRGKIMKIIVVVFVAKPVSIQNIYYCSFMKE